MRVAVQVRDVDRLVGMLMVPLCTAEHQEVDRWFKIGRAGAHGRDIPGEIRLQFTIDNPYAVPRAAVQYASQAVQFHPDGGQFDFVWLSARTPHGAYVW